MHFRPPKISQCERIWLLHCALCQSHHHARQQSHFVSVRLQTQVHWFSQISHHASSSHDSSIRFSWQNKGFFPYRFSSENHLNYVGPYQLLRHTTLSEWKRMWRVVWDGFHRFWKIRLHWRHWRGPIQLRHHFGLHESVLHKFSISQYPGHSIAQQLLKAIWILFKCQHPVE